MNGIFFYIGLGAGLAAACGLRPFLPVLLAGALGSSDALGVSFAHGPFRFLQSGWWLLAVTVALVLAYALQLLFGLAPTLDPSDRRQRNDPLAASLTGLGLGAGAALFAGTLAAHGDASWPGLLGGLLVGGSRPARVLAGDRPCALASGRPCGARGADRLPRRCRAAARGARRACCIRSATWSIALLAWFAWRGRARADEKYAGLRILRR